MLGVDAVGALTALGLEGFDGVSGLLHRASHKPANRVTLPAHLIHDLGKAGTVLALEHRHDLRHLTALAGTGALLLLGGFLGLGRGLCRGRLLGSLALRGRGLSRRCATFGFLMALWFYGCGSLPQPLDRV